MVARRVCTLLPTVLLVLTGCTTFRAPSLQERSRTYEADPTTIFRAVQDYHLAACYRISHASEPVAAGQWIGTVQTDFKPEAGGQRSRITVTIRPEEGGGTRAILSEHVQRLQEEMGCWDYVHLGRQDQISRFAAHLDGIGSNI